MDGVVIPSENAQKYIGIKLDTVLNVKQNVEEVKDKIKTQNNIISKLAGTSCGR